MSVAPQASPTPAAAPAVAVAVGEFRCIGGLLFAPALVPCGPRDEGWSARARRTLGVVVLW